MLAHEAADDQFLLLSADLAVGKALARLAQLPPDALGGVVVSFQGSPSHYRLLRPAEFSGLINKGALPDDRAPLADLLGDVPSAQVVSPYAEVTAMTRAVVVDAGRPVGVILPAPAGPVDIESDLWESMTFPTPPAALSGGEFKGLEPPQPAMPEPAATPAAAPGSAARALTAAAPAQVALGELAPLQVRLTAVGESPAGSMPLVAATGSTIDLLVKPLHGVTVEGSALASLVVAGPDESLPVLFKLRAAALGEATAQLYAFQDNQPLGSLTVSLEVVEAVADAGAENATTLTLPSQTPDAPDLTLLVLERPVGDETEITLRLSALNPALGLNLRPFGPIRLRTSPQAYFQEFFRDIDRMRLESEADAAKAERRMQRKGAQLFQTLFPPDLQALLWSLQGRIQEIQIQSEEPWIPWELCRLMSEENGEIIEGPFLCEAFAMTRWMPGIGQKPALSLNKIGLIAPGDSGLAYAKDEAAFLNTLATATRSVTAIPANYLDVTDALAAGLYDVLHFTGHGVFRAPDPNHSGMELEAGDQLVPEDISGILRNLGKASPLVFLNACQLGRSDFALTDVGGWAAQFLRANAAAFIGAYWSVYDDSALAFARTLYEKLLDGDTIAHAVLAARLAARDDGDPSWLAYTVFAHPGARVEGVRGWGSGVVGSQGFGVGLDAFVEATRAPPTTPQPQHPTTLSPHHPSPLQNERTNYARPKRRQRARHN